MSEDGSTKSSSTFSWYRENRTMQVDINGKEVTADADPCSYYTILNECPADVRLGEEIEISQNNGVTKERGLVIEDPITINGVETSEQIIFVKTFLKNVIGWKQLHDLDLMKKYTNGSYVTDVPPVLINGTEDPKNCRPGHLNSYLIEEAIGIMGFWLRKGFVEKCDSVCNSRVVLDTKPNGNINLIIRYGNLNDYSEREPPHPRENLLNVLHSIRLGKYYSICKLFYGEWQIALDTYTKYKTAFKFLGKQYAWNRVPTDYQNKNRKLIEGILKVIDKLPHNMSKRVTVHIDTILISADTKEECQVFTEKLFQHLKEHSFRIRYTPTICEPMVSFLGRELNENGVTLTKEYLYNAKKLTTSPRTVGELRTVLRCLNEAREYTPGYEIIRHNMLKLKSESEFLWSEEEEELLTLLKDHALEKRFLVTTLGENDPCTVQIFVKYCTYIAKILNREGKAYRYKSGVLKSNLDYPTQELKAMKCVWETYGKILERREVVWEVQSPGIGLHKDNIRKVTSKRECRVDFIKSERCKIKVVPEEERVPPTSWDEIS